jgi:cytochrome oxidase Cu insertion factor (SCO1/SenC/PrrC family)
VFAIGSPSTAQSDALARNPSLDPGTPLTRAAPGFTLTNQFGREVSLEQFRGKVVLLAFNDSECTTICPLTTTAMLDAKAMLGPAGAQVQLLGIDANPKATSLEDVLSYSQLHGMLSAWHFLSGALPQLQRVWKAYGVQAAVQGGEQTPALFVIDPQGRERRLYMTQQSYAAVGQLVQLLAQEAARLLPDHPPVNSNLSYAQIGGITPATPVTLPRGGGSVHLGPGRPGCTRSSDSDAPPARDNRHRWSSPLLDTAHRPAARPALEREPQVIRDPPHRRRSPPSRPRTPAWYRPAAAKRRAGADDARPESTEPPPAAAWRRSAGVTPGPRARCPGRTQTADSRPGTAPPLGGRHPSRLWGRRRESARQGPRQTRGSRRWRRSPALVITPWGRQRESGHHRTERQQRPGSDHQPADTRWEAIQRREQQLGHAAAATSTASR